MKNWIKTAIEVATSKRSLVLIPLSLCFIMSAVVLMNLQQPRVTVRGSTQSSVPGESGKTKRSAVGESAKQSETPALVATPLSARATRIADADPSAPAFTDLLIPVEGVAPSQLHDSFYDARSEGRMHQALDIMAPRNTPVMAAADGTVMKLRQSERGGIMLYQSDPSRTYVFYYGHLSAYADGISEGKTVKRGKVIAYVGDTGNAGTGNYHLHFGISKMTAAGKWYGGKPINPYPLLKSNPTATIGGK